MRALVLENVSEKAQEILAVLQSAGHQANIFLCMEDAKREIKTKRYDVFIVDLKIPKRNNKEEDVKHGIEFIKYIFESSTIDFYRPKEVIVLSGHLSEQLDIELKKYPVSIIAYDSVGTWSRALQSRLNQFINYSCDLAIITAVDVEFNAFKRWGWEEGDKLQDLNYYKKTIIDKEGNKIRVLLVKQERMGMVPATSTTNKIIDYFMPKCVVMSGICAGRKEKVSLGDVIVAIQAWDYGSGSIEEEKRNIKLIPAPEYISIHQNIRTMLERAYTEEVVMGLKQEIKEIAKNEENGTLLEISKEQINQNTKIHFGIMATGAAVIKSEQFVTNYIKSQNKKYDGIDMETYGVYYAAEHSYLLPHFFCIKSVTDVADKKKGDVFQEYCANLSALLIKFYIENLMFM